MLLGMMVHDMRAAVPTVLIVDDEEEIAMDIASALRSSGIEAEYTSSPTEVPGILREHGGIQLLISDVRMPDLDGLSLARLVKRDFSESRAIRIILMSAVVDSIPSIAPEEQEEFLFIQKPFRLASLLELADRCLNRTAERVGGR